MLCALRCLFSPTSNFLYFMSAYHFMISFYPILPVQTIRLFDHFQRKDRSGKKKTLSLIVKEEGF